MHVKYSASCHIFLAKWNRLRLSFLEVYSVFSIALSCNTIIFTEGWGRHCH